MSKNAFNDYPGDPPEYDYNEEWEKIIEELKARHVGGNRDCFEIYSESGKDADLMCGCCCFKEIPVIDDKEVMIVVAGHKTFCWDLHEHSNWGNVQAQSIADEISNVTDANSEGWDAGFMVEVIIKPSINQFTGEISIKRTVQKIITAYRKTIKPFVDEWCNIEDELLKLEKAEKVRNQTKKRLTIVK
jgi:hypothetical protein